MEIIELNWSIDLPLDFAIGETYIVTAYNDNRELWASLLMEVENYDTENGIWETKLLSVLDGSPTVLEAYEKLNSDLIDR